MSYLSFLSQSRKAGVKVILVAQADKMIDNQFRMLIEYEVKHRKLSNAGMAGWLMGLPFGGRAFVRVRYYYQMKERLDAEWFLACGPATRLYDTHAKFQRVQVEQLSAVPDPSL